MRAPTFIVEQHQMIKTVEAVIDEKGNVTLLALSPTLTS
jgi:hypothetical protein